MKTAGSTLNFNKESAAFAKALQDEHFALGDLLAKIDSSVGIFEKLDAEVVAAARKAYEDVRFQRARTEAARGRRG